MAGSGPGREVPGTVAEQLPSGLYRIVLDSGHEVVAHATGDARRNFIRVLNGDRVLVALSPRDVKRGRIVARVT